MIGGGFWLLLAAGGGVVPRGAEDLLLHRFAGRQDGALRIRIEDAEAEGGRNQVCVLRLLRFTHRPRFTRIIRADLESS
jgi:hypothetical protein